MSASTAAAVSAFAKAQVARLRRDEEAEAEDDSKSGMAVKTMGSLEFFNDEEKQRMLRVPGTGAGSGRGGPKQKRCRECPGACAQTVDCANIAEI